MIEIALTPTQTDSADWLLDCPLFSQDAQSLAHDWDVTPERAAEIIAASRLAERRDTVLVLPEDNDVLLYLRNYTDQLTEMNANEYYDELIAKGFSRRVARCRVNGAVRSSASLSRRLSAFIHE